MNPKEAANHHSTRSYFWGGLLIGLVAGVGIVELEEIRKENRMSHLFSWPKLFVPQKKVR